MRSSPSFIIVKALNAQNSSYCSLMMRIHLRKQAPRRTYHAYTLVMLVTIVLGVAALLHSSAILTDRSSMAFPRGLLSRGGRADGGRYNNERSLNETAYMPAPLEAYMMEHADKYGWNETKKLRPTCHIWTDAKATDRYTDLQTYVKELDEYNIRVKKHAMVADIRILLRNSSSVRRREDICAQVEVHPQGLQGIFTSGQLSYTQSSGYVEPLLPPLRHPKFCINGSLYNGGAFGNNTGIVLPAARMNFDHLMDLGYLVHDFGATCRQHTPTSRNIFIDMGASLDFVNRKGMTTNPAIYHMDVFRQFGFPFDHIYAFERTQIPPSAVYSKLPPHYRHAYHWINLPVSTDPKSAQNPLLLLLDNYNEDDLIVIKLDIDTPKVEMAMVQLILDDPRYERLIDHFYFEQHVLLTELARNWGTMEDTVSGSLNLFRKLREKGIAAHYWP